MGSERETAQTGATTQTTTYTPTPEETARNKAYAEMDIRMIPNVESMQKGGSDLVSKLLAGMPLPGYLAGLPLGISEEVTGDIVSKSLRDLNTQLAASGAGTFMESGASQAAGVRTAGDIRNQAAQFNLQNLSQLLNQAIGGQAQVQSPMLGYASMLSQNLAGLRSINTSGTSQMNKTYSYNPFKESFYSSFGQGLGKGAATAPYALMSMF